MPQVPPPKALWLMDRSPRPRSLSIAHGLPARGRVRATNSKPSPGFAALTNGMQGIRNRLEIELLAAVCMPAKLQRRAHTKYSPARRWPPEPCLAEFVRWRRWALPVRPDHKSFLQSPLRSACLFEIYSPRCELRYLRHYSVVRG